ncbi:hypothetical protein RFN58_06960 [Streptomyces iakyrus]|uniref:hypothetical protein n=1 Tax=Streptomyces iakyrus TaxID=68219 RepID=UPI000AA13A0B|nr:hypothetical protein [Streptomyces iakyrus]
MSSEQPDLTPRPNRILAEPATPENCAADYKQAADIRSRLGWHEQGEHQHR